MASLGGSLTGEIVGGGKYSKMIKAKNSRGSKCRDKGTGRFVKCPDEGLGVDAGVGTSSCFCPQRGISFSAYIVGHASAGFPFFGGASAEFEYPIYPEVKMPSLVFEKSKGIVGVEVGIGIKGSFAAILDTGSAVTLDI